MHIMSGIIWAIITYKYGDWKHYRHYYPTILFFGFGDLLYNLLFHNNLLWLYIPKFSGLSHSLINLYYILVIFPCTILLYLPHYPKTFYAQIKYILFWIVLYSALEWFFYVNGAFGYQHGWNLWWSVLLNCFMFPLLKLHHEKPLIVVPIFILLMFFLIRLFGVSLHQV